MPLLSRHAKAGYKKMKIFKDLEKVSIHRPVATIGIFDGVHKAHQAIIERLERTSEKLAGESTVVTLWPHPRIVLYKEDDEIQLLNTLEEKIFRLEEAGVQNLVIIPFNTLFADTSFSDFVEEILVKRLNIVHLVVGYNHHFGKNREGNYYKLDQLSARLGFGLSQQAPVVIEDKKVSSSAIRHYLKEGEVNMANRFLGYHYQVGGKVVTGNRKGRELGFPTANIAVENEYKLIPGDGVYAVIAHIGDRKIEGMMNIGCRPTLMEDCRQSLIEVHLFDWDDDLYDMEIRIDFIERIRDERKFGSISELKAQITQDKVLIKKILTSIK